MSAATAETAGRGQHRWTLAFVDPALEREYQRSATMEAADLRLSFLGAAALFLVAGLIAPIVTPIPPAVAYLAGGFELVVNLIAFAFVGRLTTRALQSRASMILNLLAALVGMSLVAASGRFDLYAAPTLMTVSVVGLVAARLQFAHSVIVATGYVVLFLAFAQRFAAEPILLQLFFVAAAATVGAAGTFLLEDASRRLFAQARLIAQLHARVDQLLHQYLSPSVAATLMSAPERAELGGEVVEVTALFADLQGFTTFSERTDPEAVVALLNDYFEAAVPPILGEGGTITQFSGDALMAIFNAPSRDPRHARRAARAALELQRACAAIAAVSDDRPTFRVGLATGPALVGNIGSRDIRNFTAIGDTINLAARLQTFAEPGQVVISDRTRDVLGPADVELLGAPALKGKRVPVAVFELRALLPEASESAQAPDAPGS